MENQLFITLKNNKFLKNIDVEKLNLDNIKGKLLTLNEGKIIFKEGDPANAVYFVVGGEVNLVYKSAEKSDSIILREHDFFGHEEFLKSAPRESTAVVVRDSYIIMLSNDEVKDLMSQDDNISKNMAGSEKEIEPQGFTTFDTGSEEASPANEVEGLEDIEENIIDDGPMTPEEMARLGLTDDVTDESKPEEPAVDLTSVDLNSDDSSDFSLDIGGEETGDSFETTESGPEGWGSETEKGFEDKSFFEKTDHEIPVQDEIESEIPVEDDKEEPTSEINVPIAEEPPAKVESKTEEADMDSGVKESILETDTGDIKSNMSNSQLQMLIKAAELVNSDIKIDDVLKNIVTVATELTTADRGTLYLIDDEKQELWSKIAMGTEIKQIRLNIGEGIAGWVAKSNEVVNIKDAKADDRFDSSYDKSSGYETKSMICLPIKNKDKKTVGVLQLLNSARGEFSDLDEELLNAMSIHAAIGLENAKLLEELLHGERVSSLGKMANFLIQDIKKPALVSKRYAEHLKNKELPQDIVQVLDMLLEQINHVADLVQTTSNYADGTSILRTMNTTVKEVVEDMCNRVDSYVRSRNCNINQDIEADAAVKVDLKQFYQCFNHIVKNACDAMPDGGDININARVEENSALISIKDNGLGIPDTLRDKIFEPFMTHGKKEGTGLGLSITKKIIEDHGGSITVISELGEGADFIIGLPVDSPY